MHEARFLSKGIVMRKITLDAASGKLAHRPELDKALLSAYRIGDQLVVTELDRLGRSLENLIDLSNTLQESGVELPPRSRHRAPFGSGI